MAGMLAMAECMLLVPWHKRQRETLRLNHQGKSMQLASQLVLSEAPLQRSLEGKQEEVWPGYPCTPGDELRGLCEEGRLEQALALLSKMDQQGIIPSTIVYSSLFKACTRRKALAHAKLVTAHLAQHGLEKTTFFGESVVRMLVDCGGLEDALETFQGLAERKFSSWTALISGYASAGRCREALRLYQLMRKEGWEPNGYTLVNLLKACGRKFDLVTGRQIHAEVLKFGFESDLFVGTCLMDMYGKCGSIMDAQVVFDGLSQRDVVSWTALLGTYVQQGEAKNALDLYEEMQEEGVSPDVRTFVIALQACGMLAVAERGVTVDGWLTKVRSLETGKAIHAHAWRKRHDSNVFLNSTLVSVYRKCGSLEDAQNVFDGLPERDVVSWNAMLAAYAQQGSRAGQALQLYEEMLEEGVTPDDRALGCALQACGMLGEKERVAVEGGLTMSVNILGKAKVIHCETLRRGYHLDVFVGSTLVTMYSKCGSIADAQKVFDGLFRRDVVIWNVMLAAYVELDDADKALDLYAQMLEDSESPDNRTFVSAIQACGIIAEQEDDFVLDEQSTKLKSLELLKSTHAYACWKTCDFDVFIGNTLVSMYGKCGSIVDAQYVFDGLSNRDVVTWNAILAAHSQQDQAETALQLYGQMQEEVSLDDRTFVSTLQACGMLADKEEEVVLDGQLTKVKALEIGKGVHAEAHGSGCESDVFVSNTLISMYSKCGSVRDARNVFDKLRERNLVSWTVMLTAHVQQGQAEEAWQLYKDMLEKCWSADKWTFVSMLQACGMLAEKEEHVVLDGQLVKGKALVKGKSIHAEAWKKGCKSDTLVVNTLISMYGKCGSITDAQDVFDGLVERDVMTWNAIVASYAEQGQADKVLQVYKEMQDGGVTPNEVTLVSILQVCSNAGKLDVCRKMHDHFVSDGNNFTPRLASILIHAYGRCGSMLEAQEVFDALSEHEVVSWTALIAGYARQGNWRASLQSYENMQLEAVEPNGVTFLALLAACSHAGLVDKGVELFESMSKDHHIVPGIEHYTSMVDLLGRAGYFKSVENLLSDMPVRPTPALWLCLLASCRKHGNLALGKHAYNSCVRLEPEHASAYVLMSNIYAQAGLWDSAEKVHEVRQKAGAWKLPGQTWIENQMDMHTFVVAEHKQQHQQQIYDLLGNFDLDVGQSSRLPITGARK